MGVFAKFYPRTLCVVALLGVVVYIAFSGVRLDIHQELLPLFEWMETTPLGVISKTWGAAFALVEAVHLLAMALLGGAVLVGDGRLLGIFFRDLPLQHVLDQSHRVFVFALVLIIATGVFMACGVALKIYYLNVFWYKMLALFTGVVFVFFIRRPLLSKARTSSGLGEGAEMSPLARRMLAVTSIMIWFSVAATGRWIGFSG